MNYLMCLYISAPTRDDSYSRPSRCTLEATPLIAPVTQQVPADVIPPSIQQSTAALVC